MKVAFIPVTKRNSSAEAILDSMKPPLILSGKPGLKGLLSCELAAAGTRVRSRRRKAPVRKSERQANSAHGEVLFLIF